MMKGKHEVKKYVGKGKIKEFEAVPNPWQGNQKPVKVEFDPSVPPKGKATVKREPLTKEEKVELDYITEAVKMAKGKPATAEPKPEKSKPVEPVAAVTTDRILAEMAKMEGEITSTKLRDALGTSRAYIRRAMKQLAKDGKVKIETKGKKQQVYKLA
jgi:predicted HTH transcriptional regulator